jgi:DNA-binding NarL/FixJ family response regulator
MTSYQKISVLIVEDNEMYAIKLKSWLHFFEISTIQIVSTIEDTMAKIDLSQPDIIILDNYLPSVKGVDVIKLLKNASPDSSIILTSANFNVEDVAAAIQNGADHLFDKNTTEKEAFKIIIDKIISSKGKKISFWDRMNFFKNSTENRKNKNIAIVEDNKMFSFFLTWSLNQLDKGHQVNVFSTAKDFYKSLEYNSPDHVFLDYHLPDANGDEIILKLKATCPVATITIISNQQNPETALKLQKLGVTNYFLKDENSKINFKKVIKDLDL